MRFDICISSVICQICQDQITNFLKIVVATQPINSNLELIYDPGGKASARTDFALGWRKNRGQLKAS